MLFTLTQPIKTFDTEEIIAEVGETLTEGAVRYLGEIYGYDNIHAEVNPSVYDTESVNETNLTALNILWRIEKTDSAIVK